MSSTDPRVTSPHLAQARVTLPLPLVMPLVVIAIIAALAIGFSKVLLSVPKEAATLLAIVMAANVLGACTVLALRPRLNRGALLELLMVVAYPIVIGIAIAQLGIAAEAEQPVAEVAAAEQGGAGGAGPTTIAAENVQFTSNELALPANEATTIRFENNDAPGMEHNIAIYEEKDGAELFKGEIIDGGESIEYEVPPLEEGDYYFQCDVHPDMNGDVTVG